MADGVDPTPDLLTSRRPQVDIEYDAHKAPLSRTATGRKARANATSLWPTLSGRIGPDPPEDLGRIQARSMRQTRGVSRRRTCCVDNLQRQRQPWRGRPLRTGAGPRRARAPGSLTPWFSASDCDRDARQRAAKSAARITDSRADHAEVSQQERNAGRRRTRPLRLSPVDGETRVSVILANFDCCRSLGQQCCNGGRPRRGYDPRLSDRTCPTSDLLLLIRWRRGGRPRFRLPRV